MTSDEKSNFDKSRVRKLRFVTLPFALIAILFDIVAIVLIYFVYLNLHLSLDLAVSPTDNEVYRIAKDFTASMPGILGYEKMHVTNASSDAESSAMLMNGRADLAIIRSDVSYPKNGATIIITKKEPTFIFAKHSKKGLMLSDINGKKVIVCPLSVQNSALVEKIFATYQIKANLLNNNDFSKQLGQCPIADAEFAVVIADVESDLMRSVVRSLSVGKEYPAIIAMPSLDALVNKMPFLSKFDFKSGEIIPLPAFPPSEGSVLNVDYLLVARDKLSEALVGDIAKALLQKNMKF